MKRKTLLVFGAIALVLAVTSGALATNRWIITKSSQVKPGAIGYKNLSAAAKAKLRGATGAPGARGPAGAAGPKGAAGAPGTSALAQFGGAVAHGATVCLGFWGAIGQSPCLGAAYASDTKSLVFGPMPAGLTIQKLTAVASIAPDVGPLVITVLNNGASTPLTCTIPKAATTCTDIAHSFSTSAGSFLEVRVSNDPSNSVSPKFIVSFAY